MDTRRIVTGQSAAGSSVFVSDTKTPRNQIFCPGLRKRTCVKHRAERYGAYLQCRSRRDGLGLDAAADGPRLWKVTFAADSVMGSPEFDPVAARREYVQAIPPPAERFEMASPGLHTTDTVDHAVLADGDPP